MDFNTENRISLADDDEIATPSHGANIKVVGIGGGGVNAVNNMLAAGLKGIEFIAINTDAKSLAGSRAQVKVQISTQRRQGLGAGGDPVIGAQAATEHTDAILDHLHGADMVFIATGLGGGTGTGAAPVIASLAAQIDALVVGVVTQPFSYEGAGRITRARQGLEELRKVADAVIVIPNDRIRPLLDPNQSLLDGFKKADDILRQAVQGVTDLITQDGYINLDFQDVRVALKGRGLAVMGIGAARGEGRGSKAALAAVKNPLLDEVKLAGAQALLINLTGNPTTADVDEVRAILGEATPADLKIGYCFNESLGDELRVTIIAAGFDSPAPVPPKITVEPIKRFTPPELAMDESLYKGGGNPYEKVNASTNAARFEIPSFFRNKKQP